ncbi:MAG: hydrogenase/urease maturation nickel metallochaperone HypA [Patescibacteria group bacterium]
MHDLHAADRILKLALEYAAKNNLKKITKISVELGTVVEHGEEINPDNLKFNLQMLSENSIAEGAEIEIGKIEGETWNLKEIEGDE